MKLQDKLQIYLITYNRAYFLERTLKQLFGDASPIKECAITILDNASTDSTAEIIRQYQAAYPHIQHIRHPVNIGGNANICRAFELGAASGKEYVWVLCDDDFYDWSSWSAVEQAMDEGADCIGVARYVMSADEQLVDSAYQMLQLTFVPAGIYKTAVITGTVLTNMYEAIYSMFQQSVLAARLINGGYEIKFIPRAVVENGSYVEDKKAPRMDCSYYRGEEAAEVLFRRKEQCWMVGYANIVRLLNNRDLQKKCLAAVMSYPDVYLPYHHMMEKYGGDTEKLHYFLEVFPVLPSERKEELLRYIDFGALGVCADDLWREILCRMRRYMVRVWRNLFSLVNTCDKKHKVLTFLGIKFKFKRNKGMKQNSNLDIIDKMRGGGSLRLSIQLFSPVGY